MKAQSIGYEKIWHRFDSADQQLLQIEAELLVERSVAYEPMNSKISPLFKKRLRMMPKIATGQYFILQLVHRFGFDVTEIASWCTLSPLMVFGIYHGKYGKWPSDYVFEKLLRFYCGVLRHQSQPAHESIVH